VGIKDINNFLAIDPMVDFNDVTISEVLPPSPVRQAGIGSPVPGNQNAANLFSNTRQRKLTVIEKRTLLQIQLWFREFSAQNQEILPV